MKCAACELREVTSTFEITLQAVDDVTRVVESHTFVPRQLVCRECMEGIIRKLELGGKPFWMEKKAPRKARAKKAADDVKTRRQSSGGNRACRGSSGGRAAD